MSNIATTGLDAADREQSAVRAGGAALLVGAAGVVVTSLFYGLSPPEAAMPVAPLDLKAAIAGAQRGAATMYAAGLVGVPADVVISAAGLLLGTVEQARGRGFASMGWFLIAVSTVLFAVVDALVGFVLPRTAAGGEQAFLVAKSLFDVLFLAGTATFGLGAVFAAAPHVAGTGSLPRLLAVAALIAALVALLGGLTGLFGIGVNPHLLGLGIAGGSFLFAIIGAVLSATGRL